MIHYIDLHPWIVAACSPFLVAAAVLLVSIPRRLANWRMRRSELLLEVADLKLRAERAHTDIDREHIERIRKLDEQRRVAGVVSAGIRAAALAKIEPQFRRRHEVADTDCFVEVRRRERLLEASKFTKLFADECQRR